jgi:hypothetical protein
MGSSLQILNKQNYLKNDALYYLYSERYTLAGFEQQIEWFSKSFIFQNSTWRVTLFGENTM